MLPPNLFTCLSDPPSRPWTPGAATPRPRQGVLNEARPIRRFGVLLLVLALPFAGLRLPHL